MPLAYPITEPNGKVGHVHLSYVMAPPDPDDPWSIRHGTGYAVLPPDFDLEVELAAEELGFGSEALEVKRAWEDDAGDFAMLNYKEFFTALRQQGAKALGGELAANNLIADAVNALLVQGPMWLPPPGEFVRQVTQLCPPFGTPRQLNSPLRRIVFSAFRNLAPDVIKFVDSLTPDPIYEFSIDPDCNALDEGSFVDCAVLVTLKLCGDTVERLILTAHGRFTDVELENWDITISSRSDYLSDMASVFLDSIDEPAGAWGIIDTVTELQRPEVPLPDMYTPGPYGAFVDDELLGYFKSLHDAKTFQTLSLATAYREATGVYAETSGHIEEVKILKRPSQRELLERYALGVDVDIGEIDWVERDLWTEV